MSAAVHAAAKTVPVGQIMFWRAGLALPFILAYAAVLGDTRKALRTKQPRLHVIRGLIGGATMACAFVSLSYLPVATYQALAYLAPVLTLPLAFLILGERILWISIGAVCVGLLGAGVLLFDGLRLPVEGAEIGLAAALGFAVLMAFMRIHTKQMTASEAPEAIAFWFAVIAALIGLATLPWGWAPLSWDSLGLLVLAGGLGGLGHILAAEALVRAPVSAMAPIEFSGLGWALLLDVVLFATFPTGTGLMGMGLVTMAALLTLWRPKPAIRAS